MRAGSILPAVGGFLLSCGPSQLYGVLKLLFHGTRLLVRKISTFKTTCQLRSQAERVDTLKGPALFTVEYSKSLKDRKIQKKETPSLLARKKILTVAATGDQKGCVQGLLSLVPGIGAFLAASYGGHKASSPLGPMVEDACRIRGKRDEVFPQTRIQYSEDWINTLQATQEFITVPFYDSDGNPKERKIESMWIEGDRNKPTIVLSHGNDANLYSMYSIAEKYKEMGYSVLAYTAGGREYPQHNAPDDANNDFSTSELSLYEDVDGVMQCLHEKGIKKVAWHGYSMGGGTAMQAAYKYGKEAQTEEHCALMKEHPDMPEVTHVLGDKIFTSVGAVSATYAKKDVDLPNIGFAVGKGMTPEHHSNGIHTTDGLNNLRKRQALRSSGVSFLFVNAHDDMQTAEGTRFAQQLKHHDKELLDIEGGHHANPLSTKQAKIKEFLKTPH